MADTTKDLDYLRFFYSSEESLKDKDMLKNKAFMKYQRNVCGIFTIPAFFQIAQITRMNRPSFIGQYTYLRNMKIFSLLGACAVIWNEKLSLEKKWRYYDKFYPEPTQLQRTLVVDAQIMKDRAAMGLTSQDLKEA